MSDSYPSLSSPAYIKVGEALDAMMNEPPIPALRQQVLGRLYTALRGPADVTAQIVSEMAGKEGVSADDLKRLAKLAGNGVHKDLPESPFCGKWQYMVMAGFSHDLPPVPEEAGRAA